MICKILLLFGKVSSSIAFVAIFVSSLFTIPIAMTREVLIYKEDMLTLLVVLILLYALGKNILSFSFAISLITYFIEYILYLLLHLLGLYFSYVDKVTVCDVENSNDYCIAAYLKSFIDKSNFYNFVYSESGILIFAFTILSLFYIFRFRCDALRRDNF